MIGPALGWGIFISDGWLLLQRYGLQSGVWGSVGLLISLCGLGLTDVAWANNNHASDIKSLMDWA